jgi:hypothetical protein
MPSTVAVDFSDSKNSIFASMRMYAQTVIFLYRQGGCRLFPDHTGTLVRYYPPPGSALAENVPAHDSTADAVNNGTQRYDNG